MLGLITAPAVRVPADFKKVLLFVFIDAINSLIFYECEVYNKLI